MNRLFGTDGIRGKAGHFPLDAATVRIIGKALAHQFSAKGQPRFVIGRDTRESGAAIERAMCEGIAAGGGTADSAGILTTPGIAFLGSEFGYDAAIVISASHNPFEDNGIKIFLPSGKKLGEAEEIAIEKEIAEAAGHDTAEIPLVDVDEARVDEFKHAYLEHLAEKFPAMDLSGIHVAVDCANGASSGLAPELFRGFGAKVTVINNEPDGRNINLNSGSLHLEVLQKEVAKCGADIGVAFDGDADRALFVDEKGEIVDGDATLWVLANRMNVHGEFASRKVVATVMSNIGLELAFRERNIELVREKVGDKYVLDGLLRTGAEIGGEQSGHIILPSISLVGDGMMTALLMLSAMFERRQPLSELTARFVKYPQTLVNVRVREKVPFETVDAVDAAVKSVEAELAGNGRLLLRYSGTENLARVMIEGKDQATIEQQAKRIADAIAAEIGE
jgi:phosphoglucosamine mutase